MTNGQQYQRGFNRSHDHDNSRDLPSGVEHMSVKERYIIRCKGARDGTGDNVLKANGMWTAYAWHQGLPYAELKIFHTMDMAQAQVDEVAEMIGDNLHLWELSIEEYGL